MSTHQGYIFGTDAKPLTTKTLTFQKAVGSLGAVFGHFPIGNRSLYGNFGVACQNLKNPRHRGIGRFDARIGGLEAIILENYRRIGSLEARISQSPRESPMYPRELSMNLRTGGQNGTSRNRSKRQSGRSGQCLVIFQ